MEESKVLDFWQCAPQLLTELHGGGVLCSVGCPEGPRNLITLGWGLTGPFYRGCPILAIAVTPERFSWHFLEQSDDFVIAVPGPGMEQAAALCGRVSGRDGDKFLAAGLTAVPSRWVSAPSVAQCPLNIECRTYARMHPPHMLLTPEHRRSPVEKQHTIYFAQVLGVTGRG